MDPAAYEAFPWTNSWSRKKCGSPSFVVVIIKMSDELPSCISEISRLHTQWFKCQVHAEAVANAAATANTNADANADADAASASASASAGGASSRPPPPPPPSPPPVGELLLPLRIAAVADDGSVHMINVSSRKPPPPFSEVQTVKKRKR